MPVKISGDQAITLSPGEHSQLIKAIVEDFAERFVPGADLIYVGDTGEKWGYFNEPLLEQLGVKDPFVRVGAFCSARKTPAP